MNTHIDTLAEWWENAEKGAAREGDTIIIRYNTEWFEIATAEDDQWEWEVSDDTRILHRVPASKPAWHGAVAVMARCSNAPEDHREPFIRSDATPDVWIGEAGYGYTDDLRDVTPLIEAKVTDEMVERGAQASTPAGVRYLRPSEVREVLTAALGIEEGP